ncbi:MAG TPA: hypothetical protein VFG12_07565, partial [Rhodopila sp.]|nr:hypothetical protein [Rhodopila sp.]
KRRAQQEDVIAQAEEARADARDNLLSIAQAAGGNASDMPALRAFLRARHTAIEARHARDAATAEHIALEQHLTTLGAALAQALGMQLPDLAMLNTLLAEADRRISADHHLAGHRQTLTEQAGNQRAARDAAAAAATKAEQTLAHWNEQWQPVAVALARPPHEPITATAEALARIEDLRATEHSAREATRRIGDMQAAIALLAARVAQLSALAPELAAQPPTEAAESLRQRLQTEQQQAIRCTDADRRLEQTTNTLAQAVQNEQEAARTLDGLRAALRAADDEQAEQQLQRARSVAAARRDSAEAHRHLLEQGGGLSLEALAARTAETTAEADAARIMAIDANRQARAAGIDAARTASAEATAALDQAGIGLNAAEAAQRREAAQAMLSRTAEEALILHATHALLQAALDRQAEGANQPLLARIGEVFRTITGGVQAGVRIEDAKDGQTMVALEADGQTRKSLDQLSEGTSDQLFLALRIAALEDYARIASPLPFVADDILQTFDDPRTGATLLALRELSHHVQVIILTHHTHVGTLADGLPAGAARVIRLDG